MGHFATLQSELNERTTPCLPLRVYLLWWHEVLGSQCHQNVVYPIPGGFFVGGFSFMHLLGQIHSIIRALA